MSVLADADLHSLVDGRIETGRRADLLRRLAASPADRAVVEAWQDQADLLRAAFRDVSTEALPAALDLAPPRLRSLDVDRGPRAASPHSPAARQGAGAAITAALLITIGLTLSWMAGSRDDGAAPAARAAVAPDIDGTAPLPAFRLPDLSAFGLRLTDVSPDAAEPNTLVLRFRGGATGRALLRIARNTPDIGQMPLVQTGNTLRWRSPAAAFALTGTLPPERLRAVASAVQADQEPD